MLQYVCIHLKYSQGWWSCQHMLVQKSIRISQASAIAWLHTILNHSISPQYSKNFLRYACMITQLHICWTFYLRLKMANYFANSNNPLKLHKGCSQTTAPNIKWRIWDGLKWLYQQHKAKKTRTGLTKKMIKNYIPQFSTFILRWTKFHGEPVIALFWHQISLQFLIK